MGRPGLGVAGSVPWSNFLRSAELGDAENVATRACAGLGTHVSCSEGSWEGADDFPPRKPSAVPLAFGSARLVGLRVHGEGRKESAVRRQGTTWSPL